MNKIKISKDKKQLLGLIQKTDDALIFVPWDLILIDLNTIEKHAA